MSDIFKEALPFKEMELPPEIQVEEFRKVVSSRRSVRVFDEAPIPESIVNDCLDMALLAPSSSNLQPWEFYWVRTPEKKAKLVEACLSQPAAKTAGELIVVVARTHSWPRMREEMLRIFAEQSEEVPASAKDYYAKLIPFLNRQGPLSLFGLVKRVLFFFRGLATPTPREPVSHSDMKTWAVKSTALAAENLMLAFRAHGYDTCPMEGFDGHRVSRLLNLPHDAAIVMVVGAGKRASGGVYGPRIRFKREWFVKEV